MKKKIISCVLLIIFCVALKVSLFSVNKNTIEYKLNNNNNIAVMVYDETEDDYVKQNSIPTGDYYLNEELSYCEGRGSIEDYDSELGVVTTKIKGSDKCYFYFDVEAYILITKDFYYTGGEQTLTLPKTGNVTIEVWGAQGGKDGGYGGYSIGTIYLEQGTTLYINVGEIGDSDATNAYNGGGKGDGGGYAGDGGGASHVALVSGQLKNLSSHANDNKILIVAGGGGGKSEYGNAGGNGGGIEGNSGLGNYGGGGGNQNSGGTPTVTNASNGSFGQGSDAETLRTCDQTRDYGAGGGGGWYGGAGGGYTCSSPRSYSGGGGGGSGYIANSNLKDKHMTCYNCSPSAESNISTYTITNTCVNATATSDCSKTGDGHIRIKYYDKNNIVDYLSRLNPSGYRGSSHTDSATQNLYRFTGSYQSSDASYAGNVDNYICLGSNAVTCPADNMYRIIGVVAEDDITLGLKSGMLKVIKNTTIGSYKWDGGTNKNDLNGNLNANNYLTWKNGATSTNTNPSSGLFPLWGDTYINNEILNATYLNGLSFSNKIAAVKWRCYVGISPTAESEYSSSLCSNVSSKIGLMYAGDYFNSYNNGVNSSSSSYKPWLQLCTSATNSGSSEYLIYLCSQWTMANYGFYVTSTYYSWAAWDAHFDGTLHDLNYAEVYSDNTFKATKATSIRPVFYLNNTTSITSGTGTYADPFRVS